MYEVGISWCFDFLLRSPACNQLAAARVFLQLVAKIRQVVPLRLTMQVTITDDAPLWRLPGYLPTYLSN